MSISIYPVQVSSGLREIRWLTNSTQLETRQLPLPLLSYKHQRSAKLRLDAVAAIGPILYLTARQDGGIIVVHAHLDLVQAERLILQITSLVSRQPLLLCQHKSKRAYTDIVICQDTLKESGITTQFGVCPGVCQTQHLLFSMFLIHCVTPFCCKLMVSSKESFLIFFLLFTSQTY